MSKGFSATVYNRTQERAKPLLDRGAKWAGTPKAVVDNYHATLVKVMADPDLKSRFAGLGVEALASTPDEFKAFLAVENAKYSKLVAENGIKAE